MKRFFIGLLATGYWLLASSTYAEFSVREKSREPRALQRSTELNWTYRSVMPRNQPPFSYFAQTYNLQMWGPLGLPSLGQTKIGLSYRLAKNELVLPLFGKSDLRGYNYTLNFWFAPRRVRDFFSSTFSFSRGTREEFLENGILASSEVNTSQVVSLNFSPQGQIDLSNIFRKNGNRNRRKKDNLNNSFFVFSFPYFSYLYAKTNTVDGIDSHPSFNRDSIVQRFYTFYNYHRLRLRYTYETKETIDLIPNKRGSGSFSHSYDASLFTQYKFLGGVVITANRSSSGSLEIPKTRSYQCTNATLSLSGKPVHFLGITSTLQSKHAFTETEMVSSRLQSTTNGLSLTSSLFLFRYFSIGNSLVYTVMQSGRDKPVQKLGESIGGYCTPLRQVRLEAHYSLNDTYHQGKMRDTEQFVRADFTPFSFLSSYLELRVNQTENLLNKEVTARGLNSTFYLTAGISPLSFFYNFFYNYNNNSNGNGNHNGNNSNRKNGYNNLNGNLLSLGSELKLEQKKNLLNDEPVATSLFERYSMTSAPFNGFLTISAVYYRIRNFSGNKPVGYREYLNSNISLQKSLFYRGLVLEIGVSTPELKKLNFDFNLRYNVRQSNFTLNYRVVRYSPSQGADYRTISASFSRKI